MEEVVKQRFTVPFGTGVARFPEVFVSCVEIFYEAMDANFTLTATS
jgi:hypothetical protein